VTKFRSLLSSSRDQNRSSSPRFSASSRAWANNKNKSLSSHVWGWRRWPSSGALQDALNYCSQYAKKVKPRVVAEVVDTLRPRPAHNYSAINSSSLGQAQCRHGPGPPIRGLHCLRAGCHCIDDGSKSAKRGARWSTLPSSTRALGGRLASKDSWLVDAGSLVHQRALTIILGPAPDQRIHKLHPLPGISRSLQARYCLDQRPDLDVQKIIAFGAVMLKPHGVDVYGVQAQPERGFISAMDPPRGPRLKRSGIAWLVKLRPFTWS